MQFFRKIKMMSRPVSPSEDIRPTFRSAVGAWVRRNRAWRPGDHARDCADRPPPSAATLHDDSIEQVLDRALEQRPDLLQQLEGVKAAEGTVREARAAYHASVKFETTVGGPFHYGWHEQLPGAQRTGLIGTATATRIESLTLSLDEEMQRKVIVGGTR